MWSTSIHDTQSGDLIIPIDYEGGAYGRGDQAIRQTAVKLHAQFTKAQWHDIVGKWWDRQILYCFNEQPVYSGTIVKAPRYNRRTGVLTIAHVDLSLILERRWLHGVGTSNGEGGYQKTGGFEVSGVSLQGAIVQLLQRLYKDPISPAWPVPVDLPSAGGGSFSKRWDFYNFENGEEIIRVLSESEGGPELDLQPKLVDGKLRFDQRIGTPLGGPAYEIHVDAIESDAESVGIGYDGQPTATGIHYPGKGSEEDMRVGAAFLPASAGLARDTMFSNKNESDVARLSAAARGRLAGLEHPVVSHPLTLKTARISPAEVRIGSPITIFSDDKLWEPQKSVCRVVGFNGSLGGRTFEIQVQEVSSVL